MAYHKRLLVYDYSTRSFTESHLPYHGSIDTGHDKRRDSIVAFLSGSHKQLGKSSLVMTLKPEMVQKIVLMAFAGIEEDPAVSSSLCEHFVYFMRHPKANPGNCVGFLYHYEPNLMLEHLEACVKSMREFFSESTVEYVGQEVIDQKKDKIADANKKGISLYFDIDDVSEHEDWAGVSKYLDTDDELEYEDWAAVNRPVIGESSST